MRHTLIALTGVVMLCAGSMAPAEEASPLLPENFDQFMVEVMRDWNLPGVGVAVSRGEQSVIRSFGVREVGRPGKVDGDTMFMLASVSKTFTVAAVAVLVDQGKVKWDDPVRRHLPEFALGDPWIAEHATIRDLLGMRSGIATDGDWLEEVPFATSKTLMQRSRFLGQAYPFRSVYEYNNYNYTIIGELIERVSGMPWNVFVKQHVLQPLALANTQVTAQNFIPVEHLAPGGEVILPGGPVGAAALVPPFTNVVARHAMHPDFTRQLAFHKDELANTVAPYARFSIDPSTSVFCSTQDLHRWARMWLGLGQVGGVRLLSENSVREMRRHQSLAAGDASELYLTPAERIAKRRMSNTGYGLGMQLGHYADHAYAGHGGSDIGVGAYMLTFPADDVTVVVLVNNSLYGGGSRAAAAILYTVLDHLFGYPAKDWSAEQKRTFFEAAEREYRAGEVAMTAARSSAPLSADLKAYAGTYSDGGHRGRVEIRREGNRLRLILLPDLEAAADDPYLKDHLQWARALPPPRSADLTHWGGDTFQIRWRGPRRTAELISFTLDQGRPVSLNLPKDTRGGPATLPRVAP